ncbi:hypothetical protein BDR07DRAFT_14129 [Suillus spraguei]|nr:hypothetical protein BDR07DRAFT_14129 [Suillus spraguei]
MLEYRRQCWTQKLKHGTISTLHVMIHRVQRRNLQVECTIIIGRTPFGSSVRINDLPLLLLAPISQRDLLHFPLGSLGRYRSESTVPYYFLAQICPDSSIHSNQNLLVTSLNSISPSNFSNIDYPNCWQILIWKSDGLTAYKGSKMKQQHLSFGTSSQHWSHEAPVVKPVGFIDKEARVDVLDALSPVLLDTLSDFTGVSLRWSDERNNINHEL